MNIFRREWNANSKSAMIWALALSGGTVLFMMLFPAFSRDVETSRKLLESFPPALRSALNLSLENFFTVLGFYAYLLNFILVAGAIQAMNLGVGILAKEFSGKTADFLLSKPVTRTFILSGKLLAALTLLGGTNFFFVMVSLVAAISVSPDSFSYPAMILLASMLLMIQLFFLGLGILFSVVLPKIKSSVAVSLPTVFGFYTIGALESILGAENVRYITPFKYFETNYIISHHAYDATYLLIETFFIIVTLAISFIVFRKKDIRAAA